MEFVAFVENNDWEGETWRFWLQVDGNEQALEQLREFTDDEEFVLDSERVQEWEVDVLVKWTDSGYLYYENKVTGKLEIPENFRSEDLYKGRVEDLFKE